MKNRKGFTLIELMIVIAIIIILAAIAIPNYLRMTERARRSRVAGDMTALATAFEAYKVDWSVYPLADAAIPPGIDDDGGLIMKDVIDTDIENELVGTGSVHNITATPGNYTLTGEESPIEYIKKGTLQGMFNPFQPTDGYHYYIITETVGTTVEDHWVLYVYKDTGKTQVIYRTDMVTDIQDKPVADLPANF